MAKKILIFYITEHSGHHSAASAIKNALALKDPSAQVSCVNVFHYCFPLSERIIHNIYLTVIQRVPKIWESMYDNPRLVHRSQWLKNKIHHLGIKKLKRLIDEFKPCVVAATQAFPCGLMADYKEIYCSQFPLVGVLTDLAPHSYWIYNNVDYYIAPCEQSKELLIEKGIPKEKIKCFGIPIDPKFANTLEPKELFLHYGLNAEIPVIMMMGGGHGLGPIKEVLRTLDQCGRDLQFIVVCGLNTKLYHWVNTYQFKNRVLNFKFTDQIDRLMSIATLLITKPGGITTAEALAKKLPMIILNPIPGQEARNTAILKDREAAWEVDQMSELLAVVQNILEHSVRPSRIFSTADGFRDLSKPHSSIDIAQFILSLC